MIEEAEQPQYEFDAALSFAGEDREYVTEVNAAFKLAGVRTFLDSDHVAKMWGENLVEFLDGVYRKRARFTIMFISHHYAEKVWTRLERRSALARALTERSAYILPVRLDDTELDGLLPTIGHVDAIRYGTDGLVQFLLERLMGEKPPGGGPVTGLPRNRAEAAQIARERPSGWEWSLLAGWLRICMDELDDKYHDHVIRFAPRSGRWVSGMEVVDFMKSQLAELGAIAERQAALMEQQVTDAALGPPGEPGDPAIIRRLAHAWTVTYEDLLDFASRIRGAGYDSVFREPFEMLADTVDPLIRSYREYVARLESEFAAVPGLVAGDGPPVIKTLVLVLKPDDGQLEAMTSAFAAAVTEAA